VDDATTKAVDLIVDEGQAIEAICALERRFGLVVSAATRYDVECEFQSLLEDDGIPMRDLTDEEWDLFRTQWGWRKGIREAMWDGIPGMIRDDLIEAGLIGGDGA
jgi:hypothetical protein